MKMPINKYVGENEEVLQMSERAHEQKAINANACGEKQRCFEANVHKPVRIKYHWGE